MKLTKKEIEFIKLLRDGWIFIIGTSDTTGRQFYQVAKGYESVYFRSDTFARLLTDGLIYQEYTNHNYVLTDKGETCELK